MKTIQSVLWLCLMSVIGCDSDPTLTESETTEVEFKSDVNENPNVDFGEPALFRDGIKVYPQAGTSIDHDELAARDGYKTTFTDPYGFIWELGTASGLEEGDFREHDFIPSLNTEPAFYHRMTDNEDGLRDCVVYIEADMWNFAVLRRGDDQGTCPTTEEYRMWLPAVAMPESKGMFATLESPLSFGSYTGSFNGVNSYSNSYPGYYCPDFKPYSQCVSYVGGNVAGIKWQCVEYADRYYLAAYNHTNLWKGHAKYWYSKATQHGLKSYPNCGNTVPKIGDMLVSTYGSYGHIAIVRSVGLMSVTVIQQNWFENEKDNYHVIPMGNANGKFCVSGFGGSSYPVAGWIRK